MRCRHCGSPYMVRHLDGCPYRVKGRKPEPKDYGYYNRCGKGF